jgi:hypothetical protein
MNDKELNDKEINQKLAEAMGHEHQIAFRPKGPSVAVYHSKDLDGTHKQIDYKDPAIFAENVKWLAHHVVAMKLRLLLLNESPERAVALARIKVMENENG